MKKIINGKLYNTETAKKLGDWESDQDYRGLYHEEEVLYRNKAGNYFLYGYGGAGSKYSQQIGVNEWSSGESILPLEEEDARKWAEAHLDGNEYEMIFGEPGAAEDVQATVRIPAAVAQKLTERMEKEKCNRNDLILAAIREYLK